MKKAALLMVAYCDSLIKEIRSADSEIELRRIIDRSMNRFKTRNTERYIINMIVALQASGRAGLPAEDLDNTIKAIEIFRDYRKKSQDLLF